MATFGKLPEELIDQIVDEIQKTGGTTTLASLALSSRKFYRIANPYLYCAIDVVARGHEELDKSFILHRCLQNTLARENLAKQIQVISAGPERLRSRPNRWTEIPGRGCLETQRMSLGWALGLSMNIPGKKLVNLEILDLPSVPLTIKTILSLRSSSLKFVDLNLPLGAGPLALYFVFQLPSIESIGLRRVFESRLNYFGLDNGHQHGQNWLGRTFKVKHLLFDGVKLPALITSACPMLSQTSEYTPWYERPSLQFAVHSLQGTERRYELRTLKPRCFYCIEAVDGPSFQMFTPWRMENKDQWEHFEILTSGKNGTRALVEVLQGLELGGSHNIDWKRPIEFIIRRLQDNESYFGAISFVVGVEKVEKKWLDRVLSLQEDCSNIDGLEFRHHMSTGL